MLHLLKLDYQQAPIALREKVAFSDHAIPAALLLLREQGATEAAILSTCNRVELFACYHDSERNGQQLLLDFLAHWHNLPAAMLQDHFAYLTDNEAARHMIRVACGLESLVPGEMQILGQVKEMCHRSREGGALGPLLDRLFTAAISAGRRARWETGIARRPVSISHSAVTLIQQHFEGDLAGRKVLLIGSGKMGEIAAQQLHKAGATHFIVANRTLERACELAQRWDGTPLPWDDMPLALAEADAVISATAAPHTILHRYQMEAVMAQRAARPLLLVDLAVPRDIDAAIRELDGITLCDVDGLQNVVAQNIAMRNEEREAVEAIVEETIAKFQAEQAARTVASTITTLRQSAETIRQAEVQKALTRLGELSEREQSIIEAMSRSLVNKLLHNPTVSLRQKATTDEGALFQQTVEALFALKRDDS